jgi:hypothetical protein
MVPTDCRNKCHKFVTLNILVTFAINTKSGRYSYTHRFICKENNKVASSICRPTWRARLAKGKFLPARHWHVSGCWYCLSSQLVGNHRDTHLSIISIQVTYVVQISYAYINAENMGVQGKCECQYSQTWTDAKSCVNHGTCNVPCKAEGYDYGECQGFILCYCCKNCDG